MPNLKIFTKVVLIILFAVFTNKSTLAKNILNKTSSTTEKNSHKYFGYESTSPYAIDKPFKINSLEHQSQIDQIIILQKNIDPKDIDLALEEKQLRPETVVQKICKTCTRAKFTALYHLLDRVGDTSRDVNDGFKDFWKIPRPYIYDTRIQMMITPSKGYSYPSGHTTGSYIYAGVLGLLIPNKIEELQDYANQIAWHRVQVGMHYPQDLTGGKQLAIYLIGGLMQNKDFQNDFNLAKFELKKSRILK